MDGKTLLLLLLLSGCETWVGPEMADADTVQLLTYFFLTDASNNTNNSSENENASVPTRHHLYCRHLK